MDRLEQISRLAMAMAEYDKGDPRRINHFLKVWGYARTIGAMEGLAPKEQFILEAAALTHDIGIKVSEEKYGSCAGPYQEKEGPPVAEEMLAGLGFPEEVIRRVCWLIAHHHTYGQIVGQDYQILVEADFLVNLDEGGGDPEAVASAETRIFRTKTGKTLLSHLFKQQEE